MNIYETIILVKPDIDESAIEESTLKKVKSIISANKGELIDVDNWGLKKLAYNISNYDQGYYIMIHLKGNPDLLKDIERSLQLDENIIRFLTVRLEEKELEQRSKEDSIN